MNIFSFSSLIAAIFCLSSGIFVFIKRRGDRKCELFAIASLLTGLWALFPFVMSKIHNQASLLFFARIIYLPAIFTGPAWLHFVFAVIKEERLIEKRIALTLSYCFSAPVLFFSFSPQFLKGVVRFAPHFSVIPGPVYIYFVSVFGLIFIYVIKTIFSDFIIASGYHRNHLKFILLSFIFGLLSGILHFGAAYFNKEPFPHDLFLIGYTGLISYAMLKYRLMDINVAITRTGIFVAVYTLVLGLPFAIAGWFKNWLMDIFSANWWIFPLGLMATMATLGPFIYIFLNRKAEEKLLYEQHRYQEILKQTAREMTRIHNLKRLLNLIVRTVTRTVRISHSAIYLFDAESRQYLLKASLNLKTEKVTSIKKENSLIFYLENQKEPLVHEEIKRKAQDEYNPVLGKLERQMRLLNAAVIVPSFLKDRLLGFLVLGDKHSGKVYTSADLNIFSVLASQSALSIENALLYGNIEEQVKQRTKELVEIQKQLIHAEKLATVGTLAGGVAHEINNPLTAILTNVQLLLTDNNLLDTGSKESLELIEEATRRCRTIVQKLMAYARKPLESTEVSRVDLLNVIKNTVAFLSYQLQQENIKIITEVKQDTYFVIGNHNELEQIVTNIILNARDAIKKAKKKGTIYISLTKSDTGIKLKIEDEGAGIPKEIYSKIFDPFFTTKDVGEGLGLGLSICQAIADKHKGLITVQSNPDKGSVFTVQLPKAEEKSMINSEACL